MTRETLKAFFKDESGAVTVDWVVLTASIVALNVVAIINLMETGVSLAGSQIVDQLSTIVSDMGN